MASHPYDQTFETNIEPNVDVITTGNVIIPGGNVAYFSAVSRLTDDRALSTTT